MAVMQNVKARLAANAKEDSGVHEDLRRIYKDLGVAVESILSTQGNDRVKELAHAAVNGDLFGMRRVLVSFSPDAADGTGRVALHNAAAQGVIVSVRFLLQSGANPNVKDAAGITPLFEAVRNGHAKCAEAIRLAGGRLDIPRAHQGPATPGVIDAGLLICQACSIGDSRLLSALLENGMVRCPNSTPVCCSHFLLDSVLTRQNARSSMLIMSFPSFVRGAGPGRV